MNNIDVTRQCLLNFVMAIPAHHSDRCDPCLRQAVDRVADQGFSTIRQE